MSVTAARKAIKLGRNLGLLISRVAEVHRIALRALFLALLVSILPGRLLAADEQTFGSPDEAVKALLAAATNHDTNALHAIFGPEGHQLVSPDVVQATNEFKLFVQRLEEKTQLSTNSDSTLTLDLGADGWPKSRVHARLLAVHQRAIFLIVF